MNKRAIDLPLRIQQDAKRHHLFPDPGTALLAVSAGPDSVALLDLFAAGGIAEHFALDLVVAHVDHGIASNSAEVSQQVETLARRYGLRFMSRRLALGTDATETEAREARYEALRAMQADARARYLVTAHHADDQAETILFRALRGSGIAGLAGIPPRGPDGLVRPLLDCPRVALVGWAEVSVGKTHEDPANRDPRHDRSWLRTEIFPVLEGRWPGVADRLRRLGRHARADRRAWSAVLTSFAELEFSRTENTASLARAPLRKFDAVLSRSLLRALGREVGAVIGPKRAQRLLEFALRGTSGKAFDLSDGWQAILSFDRLQVEPVVIGGELPGPHAFGVSHVTFRFGRWEFTAQPEPARRVERASMTTWLEPVDGEVRSFSVGDWVRPIGGVGRRKVRRLLMEARVPMSERRIYPVVVQRGRVVWVPGVCRSANAVPQDGAPALRLGAKVVGDS